MLGYAGWNRFFHVKLRLIFMNFPMYYEIRVTWFLLDKCLKIAIFVTKNTGFSNEFSFSFFRLQSQFWKKPIDWAPLIFKRRLGYEVRSLVLNLEWLISVILNRFQAASTCNAWKASLNRFIHRGLVGWIPISVGSRSNFLFLGFWGIQTRERRREALYINISEAGSWNASRSAYPIKSTTSLKTGILGLLALRICFSAGVRSSTTPQPGTAGAEALTSESLT